MLQIYVSLITAVALPASAAVYVVAHPDDDILMMGPNLITDIRENYPTVIIVVTAGDAALGNKSSRPEIPIAQQLTYNDAGLPYYRVRLNAREYMLDSLVPQSYSRPLIRTYEKFNTGTQSVERIVLGNVVEYHLNLPDSGSNNGKTVMQNLRDDSSFSVQDVEGLNTYTGSILRTTIRQIIELHNRDTPTLVINYQEPQPADPSADHADHTSVGSIVAQAIAEQPSYGCMWRAVYPGYSGNAVNKDDPATTQFWFPNLLEAHRAAYERTHEALFAQGNITPVSGGPVVDPDWEQTTYLEGYTDRQHGTMDAFHTSFYGKAKWYGIASNGPCKF